MQHLILTLLTWMTVGHCLLCKGALLKIDYGVQDYFYDIEFSPEIFKRFISCLTDRRTKICRLSLKPIESSFSFKARDVREELFVDYETSSVVPKYLCGYQSVDQSFKCERVKVLVICQNIQTSDLFGIKWVKEGEYISDSSIINSTHQCSGEYGSKWPVTYYSWSSQVHPINYEYTKPPFVQRSFTSGEKSENTMRKYTFVETSTLNNLQKTGKTEETSNASLPVIVTCSVLGVIIVIIFGVVTYFLICRKKLRKRRNGKPTVTASPPQYDEVRFLPDNNRLANVQASNNNFSGISNIYSYPFPYSVNKKQDKKNEVHISNVSENSISDYSNPVDSYADPNLSRNGVSGSYTDLEVTSSHHSNGFNKAITNNKPKTSDYSTPDDSYKVPRTSNGQAKSNGDYMELESVTYSNKDYQEVTSGQSTHDYSNPGDCVPKGITQQKVHEYNKLGEEKKILLHDYDHLEKNPDTVNKPAVYSLSKNFDS